MDTTSNIMVSSEANPVDNISTLSTTMITPPSSTIRKNKTIKQSLNQQNNNNLSDPTGKEPLSPSRSSPIAPTKSRRNRSDGCSRINGSLSLNDIIQSLIRRKKSAQFNDKPPYSYAILICLAILQSPEGKLTLSQIYHWISKHFPFFQLKDASWQNSIRHNLSLNEGFIKTMKSYDGKGHFWQVKESSAQKFFKHESRSYDEIREKLKDLDLYFFQDSSEFVSIQSGSSTFLNNNKDTVQTTSITMSNLNTQTTSTIYDRNIGMGDFDEEYEDNNNDGNDSNDDNEEGKEESRDHNGTPLIQISSPPQYMNHQDDTMADSNKGFPHYIGLLSNTNLTNAAMTMKRSQTSLGFQPYENNSVKGNNLVRTPVFQSSATFGNEFPPIQDMFPNQSMFSNSNNQSLSLLSPRNCKKYICSFNSSFDMSPQSKIDAPSPCVDMDNNENNESSVPLHVKSNADQVSLINHLELLKTPELRRSHSLETTPIQLLRTPLDRQIFSNETRDKFNDYNNGSTHDSSTTTTTTNTTTTTAVTVNSVNTNGASQANDSNNEILMKNWKTPSHLFEDIYSSPIMKAMGKTPITRISSTPNGTIIKTFSPRKLSAPDINHVNGISTTTIKTKLSSGGLFGVDVYSVWERALKDIDCSKPRSVNEINTTITSTPGHKNEKLDLPFVSKTQTSSSPK